MMAVILGAIIFFGIVAMLRSSGRGTSDVPPAGTSPRPIRAAGETVETVSRDPEVIALVDANRKIDAIKRVREATGLGLKESKDVVDAISAARGK